MTQRPFTARCAVPARLRWVLALVSLLAIPGSAAASSGTFVLSSSVIATYFGRTGPSGLEHLELLVLWRGQPGWLTQSGSSGGSSVTTIGGGNSGTAVRFASTSRRGGLDLLVTADLQHHSAVIQGRHAIDLREHNVVFIDNVDDGSGGTIVRLLRIEAGLLATPGPPGQLIVPVLRATPEFLSFLRCGQGPALGPGAPDICAAILRP